MDGGEKLIEIAEVVLAELAGGITHRLERRSNGHRLRWYTDWRAGLADRSPCMEMEDRSVTSFSLKISWMLLMPPSPLATPPTAAFTTLVVALTMSYQFENY